MLKQIDVNNDKSEFQKCKTWYWPFICKNLFANFLHKVTFHQGQRISSAGVIEYFTSRFNEGKYQNSKIGHFDT